MDAKELKNQLQMLEQIGRAVNLALKHSSPEVRIALQREGFDKNKRIIVQRMTYLMVKACRSVMGRIA